REVLLVHVLHLHVLHHENLGYVATASIHLAFYEGKMQKDKKDGNTKQHDDCSGEEKNKKGVDNSEELNLEGNSCIPEPNFSCLASKEIIDISKKMGVNINEQNMESIELLKEMELARQCLGQKKTEILQKKEVDNMEKKENTKKEFRKKILASTKKSETLGKSQKLDPSGDYLIDDLDVGSFKKGNHILQHNLYLKGWDWNLKGIKKKRRDQIASELKKLEEIEESDLLNSNQIDYRCSLMTEILMMLDEEELFWKQRALFQMEENKICWDIVKNDTVSLFQDFHAGQLDIKEATKIQQLKKGKKLAYDKIGKYIKSYKGPR
ncbi:hypothetical protein ACJX0J_025452, partial [Zea mays]